MKWLLAVCVLLVSSTAQAGIHFGFTDGPFFQAAAHARELRHERSMTKMSIQHEQRMARYGMRPTVSYHSVRMAPVYQYQYYRLK